MIPFAIYHDEKLRSCKKNVSFRIHNVRIRTLSCIQVRLVTGIYVILYSTGNGSLYFPAAAKEASRFHDYVINFFLLLTFFFNR